MNPAATAAGFVGVWACVAEWTNERDRHGADWRRVRGGSERAQRASGGQTCERQGAGWRWGVGAQPPPGGSTVSERSEQALFAPGETTAIGSLPHRDPVAAARCALAATTLPCMPSLPRRSPAESMVAQAVSSLPGVTLGQYGSVAIDATRFDPQAAAEVNLGGESFGGLRAFLDLAVARQHRGPVKWQFIGPVTLGVSLIRAGASRTVAFRLAVGAVRAHLAAIADEVERRLPDRRQLVFLDEPWFDSLMSPDFPIPPETAVDLTSEAMASVESQAVVGVHCCGPADVSSLLASGPRVLSIPPAPEIADAAGYLQGFLERGGTIAWGAVATGGPILTSVDRYLRGLWRLHRVLVERGCDPELLRSRVIVTPECGLGLHSMTVAQRVLELTDALGQQVRSGVPAAQFR